MRISYVGLMFFTAALVTRSNFLFLQPDLGRRYYCLGSPFLSLCLSATLCIVATLNGAREAWCVCINKSNKNVGSTLQLVQFSTPYTNPIPSNGKSNWGP